MSYPLPENTVSLPSFNASLNVFVPPSPYNLSSPAPPRIVSSPVPPYIVSLWFEPIMLSFPPYPYINAALGFADASILSSEERPFTVFSSEVVVMLLYSVILFQYSFKFFPLGLSSVIIVLTDTTPFVLK